MKFIFVSFFFTFVDRVAVIKNDCNSLIEYRNQAMTLPVSYVLLFFKYVSKSMPKTWQCPPPPFFKQSNTNIYSPELHALGTFASSHKFMRECFNESLAQNMNNILQVENELNRVFRSWHYQTCNEFGWFQSGDAKNHAFGISPPLEFYLQRCKL